MFDKEGHKLFPTSSWIVFPSYVSYKSPLVSEIGWFESLEFLTGLGKVDKALNAWISSGVCASGAIHGNCYAHLVRNLKKNSRLFKDKNNLELISRDLNRIAVEVPSPWLVPEAISLFRDKWEIKEPQVTSWLGQ